MSVAAATVERLQIESATLRARGYSIETAPPVPLFGTEFRCVYIHDDGSACQHLVDGSDGTVHWFCPAHIYCANGDEVQMCTPRLVPRPRSQPEPIYPTVAQLMSHIQWVLQVRKAQVQELLGVVQHAADNVDAQMRHFERLQEQAVDERRPVNRAKAFLRKALMSS